MSNETALADTLGPSLRARDAVAITPATGLFGGHSIIDAELGEDRFDRTVCFELGQRAVLGPRQTIEVASLDKLPLLLMDGGFGFRRAFDAASRLAALKPTIRFESRNPHTLLALAEAGHGVAIVPSQLQCRRYRLKIVGLTFRGRTLREPLTISWDKRRPLPRFATDYCTMLASYMSETFPVTRPSAGRSNCLGVVLDSSLRNSNLGSVGPHFPDEPPRLCTSGFGARAQFGDQGCGIERHDDSLSSCGGGGSAVTSLSRPSLG